jgi:hypothetical protein
MSREMVAGEVQRLLVERRGDDRIDPAGARQPHRAFDGEVG